MVYVIGSNNGQSGFGMNRALFPSNMGGSFGNRAMQLPNSFQHPVKMFGSKKAMSVNNKRRHRHKKVKRSNKKVKRSNKKVKRSNKK